MKVDTRLSLLLVPTQPPDNKWRNRKSKQLTLKEVFDQEGLKHHYLAREEAAYTPGSMQLNDAIDGRG